MNKVGFIRTICLLSTIVYISCAGSETTTKEKVPSSPADNIVGQVGDTEITYSELKSNFISGSIDKEYSLEELQEFLPVYLDYRAKIKSAEEQGYYDKASIKEELELYTKQAAYAYWMDKEIRPSKFNEFKERFNKELKSSHILVAVNRSAPPQDTLEAYNKIMEAREQFLSGTSITKLDSLYSSKRNGRSMGGSLPWFSVGTTVKEFEDALYNLEIGEISEAVRTQFGYHLILLEDERERVPERLVSHIFMRPGANSEKPAQAYQALKDSLSWAEAVDQFSEDRPSVPNQGRIGWINFSSRFNPEFIDSVMAADPSLPFTKPITSPYGVHILRIDSVKSFSSDEERDEFILGELKKSNSFSENNSYIVKWLQENYTSETHTDNLEAFENYVTGLDTTKFHNIALPDEIADSVVYTFDEYNFTAADYLSYLSETKVSHTSKKYLSSWIAAFKTAKVDEKITALTLKEFPEFEDQVDNYKKGLVVYQINEDSVWSASTIDSTLLLARYNDNPETYSFDTRYKYTLIVARQDSLLEQSKVFIQSGNSPDSLRAKGFRVRAITDSTGAFQGEPFSRLEDMKENTFSEIFEYNGQKAILYLAETLPPRRMTFEEAFNRIVSDYQPEREEKWLSRLRDEYSVIQYPDNLAASYQRDQQTE